LSIKKILKNWLFKDELDQLHKSEEYIKLLKNDYDWLKSVTASSVAMFNNAQSDMNHSTEIANQCRKTMNAICDVGIDIGFKDDYHNWAVICIHGKTEFVKFVPLIQKDVRYVADFLKQFEYSKRRIDSPLGYREMIEDYIIKM
jgi:hypothetical protein